MLKLGSLCNSGIARNPGILAHTRKPLNNIPPLVAKKFLHTREDMLAANIAGRVGSGRFFFGAITGMVMAFGGQILLAVSVEKKNNEEKKVEKPQAVKV